MAGTYQASPRKDEFKNGHRTTQSARDQRIPMKAENEEKQQPTVIEQRSVK